MNPPYGPEIRRWLAKAVDSADAGATVVSLLPAKTDTGWWHDFVAPFGEVELVRGRVCFNGVDGPAGSAPFASCVVVFRPGFRNGGEWDESRDETARQTPPGGAENET
jgi:site-specific DNA-methyltransferase (adenine-specific)